MSNIDIIDVSRRFEEHLSIENNYRIIFSGKFGIGKTYFVDKFFKERNEQFNTLIISPVNYVVNSNEDIIELIKADIIKQLFSNSKIEINSIPAETKIQKASTFVENNPFLLQNFMAKFLTKLNPSVDISIQIIEKIHKICTKYKEDISNKNTIKSISEEALDYASESEEKVGSIYEYNYITKVITNLLRDTKKENKKNVLVIDDLDRIDPEHIFRILNILSAHNNYFDSANKFNFDHIVIVCDIENIHKIYQHKYGEIDFDGYMDKFYSTDIFHFTNKDSIQLYIKKVFENKSVFTKGYLELFEFILEKLIDNNVITLRKLLKHKILFEIPSFILFEQIGIHESKTYMNSNVGFINNGSRLYVDNTDLQILRIFKMCSIIFGSLDFFLEKIKQLKYTDETIEYDSYIDLISFLALQNHISEKTGDDLFFYKHYDQLNNSFKALTSVSWPVTKFLDMTFSINLKWTNGNVYTSSVSYFFESNIFNKKYEQSYSDRPKITIKISDIFKSIEKIILNCQEKKYLQKANIFSK